MAQGYWTLWPALIGLIGFVAWVGWRFFLVAQPRELAVAGALIASDDESTELQAPRVVRLASVGWIVLVGVIVGGVVFMTWTIAAVHARVALPSSGEHVLPGAGHALDDERLVPPPTMPPAAFADAGGPALVNADRDWHRLDPAFAQRLLRLFAQLERQGHQFVLIEGYRSPERQDALADRGPHVTNARAFESRHQFGLAADLAPVRDGRIVIDARDPWARDAYQALGRAADAVGLIWGGHWAMRDLGHVETEHRAGVGHAAR